MANATRLQASRAHRSTVAISFAGIVSRPDAAVVSSVGLPKGQHKGRGLSLDGREAVGVVKEGFVVPEGPGPWHHVGGQDVAAIDLSVTAIAVGRIPIEPAEAPTYFPFGQARIDVRIFCKILFFVGIGMAEIREAPAYMPAIAGSIEIGVPKREAIEVPAIRKGRVEFFNHSKGFGFIKESDSQEKFFVHVNSLTEEIKEGDIVTFELERGFKGMSAIRVNKVK